MKEWEAVRGWEQRGQEEEFSDVNHTVTFDTITTLPGLLHTAHIDSQTTSPLLLIAPRHQHLNSPPFFTPQGGHQERGRRRR